MFTIVTVLGSIAEGVIFPLYYIYTLTVKNKIPCFVTVLGGILNVIGMYVLIKYTTLGVYAIVWPTAIITMFINFVFNPIYMSKCLEMSKLTFYPVVLRNIISCIAMTISFKTISLLFNPNTWVELIEIALLYCIVGCFIHVIAMFRRDELVRVINSVLKRLKLTNNVE